MKTPEAAASEIARAQIVHPPSGDYGKGERFLPTYNNAWLSLELQPWGFAYDELAQAHVLLAAELPWPDHYSRELNDDTLRVIRNWLLDNYCVEFTKDDVREACLSLSRAEPFNPVCEYLDSLKWDGTERIDSLLPTYFGSPDNEYTRAVGRLFLLGAVARAKRPGCKFDTALILEGPQGSGKSSALKILGGPWLSESELGNVRDKDAAIALRNVWIQELGELTTLTRSDRNDLKAFISRCDDRYRPPYGRSPITEPRRCVFAGTTNEIAYLVDATGDRRFWPVVTGAIDLDALRRDRDQIWAEAVAADAAGASLVLESELWPVAAEEQAARRIEEPWADLVEGYVVANRLTEVTTSKLLTDAIGVEAPQQNTGMAKKVAGILATLGYRRRKVRKGDATVWVFQKA